MKYLGVIPARGGSKGIPKKNIKKLMGKPLIEYTIDAALNSDLDDVVVTSDCEEILEFSRNKGVRTITRPQELSRDDTPSRPVIEHALREFEGDFDAVVTLQPTSPLRTSLHIDQSIDTFNNQPDANSLVSVTEVPHNMVPESIMCKEEVYLQSYLNKKKTILRRQDKEKFWARNGAAIYITKVSNIKDYIFGGKIIPYEMDKLSSFDIDEIEDWLIVEAIMEKLINRDGMIF